IATARREAALTQKELADRLGISLWSLDRLESGASDESPGGLAGVARITGKPESWFRESAEAPPAASAVVGERVLTARQEAGLTQKELAERLGTSLSAVERVESAKSELPGRLEDLAEATGK